MQPPSAVPPPARGETPRSGRGPSRRRVLKWVLLILAVLFFLSVLREAVNPFGESEYLEISHGNHSHYVPRDRDPNVPLDRFPTQRPGPNERITPDGRIVPK